MEEFKKLIARAVAATGTGVSSLYNHWTLAFLVGYILLIPPLVGVDGFLSRRWGASKGEARATATAVMRMLYLMPEVTSLPPPPRSCCAPR